ncbi:MAG TPA: sodium-translocating pyrophosphatase [Candidatus Bathyarchaeia archaeon]|nr:sodium-translocating pyrophosphatase [Candidatus Bathyarchaeia archaeon]
MSLLIDYVFAVSFLSLIVAGFLVRWILKQDQGTKRMQEISAAIKLGAETYLWRQYKTISIIVVIFTVLLAVTIRSPTNTWLGVDTAVGFLLGALCSNLAGYIAMYISVRSNVRSAKGAMTSLDRALKIAFRGGVVFGLAVVSLSLLGISSLFLILGSDPHLIVGFGFGASFAALFAQLGGGIFTKAADMSADLVGKVEKGIPEDDPRNPAVIADLVGDNVGDIAGRGADLFESITAENIGAMILGVAPAVYSMFGINGLIFPLLARGFGLIGTMIGMFFVYSRKKEDPFSSLTRGLVVTGLFCAIGFYVLTVVLLNSQMNFFYAALVGIVTAIFVAWITDYYTSYRKRPTLEIAIASEGGPAPSIATGLAVGMESSGLFIIVIGIAIMLAFGLGNGFKSLGPTLDITNPAFQTGIYGTAIATMGMLSVTPMILAMDGFGPITDNAGGILEMSGVGAKARAISDKLDSVGNTTKALTKGYGVASAALSAFLLFSAFLEVSGLNTVNLARPEVFIGAMVGAMLIFLFSSLAIKAVGKTAAIMIIEIRRQFKAMPGIMKGTVLPDYSRCIDISTKAALKNMVWPSLLVVIGPIVVGLILGAEAVGGLLMIGTVVGVLMALFMNNVGAALDNAKKYIETGSLGGKGSAAHAATVIGDTLGDPLKDTAGPSLHVVVKLLNTITLAMAPLFVLALLH